MSLTFPCLPGLNQLQIDVTNLVKISPRVISATVAPPSSYVKFDEAQADDPTSYYVVPYDAQHCFDLHVSIVFQPPATSLYKDVDFVRIILQYNGASSYPQAPPRISFTTPLVHYAVDGHNFSIKPEEMKHFTQQLQNNFSILNVVAQLEEFFTVPLHPCPRCNQAFAQYAHAHFQHYVQLAHAYRSIRNKTQADSDAQGGGKLTSSSSSCSSSSTTAPSLSPPPSSPSSPTPPLPSSPQPYFEFQEFQEFQNQLYNAGTNGWPSSWFDPRLMSALQSNDAVILQSLMQEIEGAPGVFTFPMFTLKTCELILQELDCYNASGLPSPRPNSMNKYGLILNSIGLSDSFARLQQDVLNQISRLLFPEIGLQLDAHHTFLVQYTPGEDLGLDMHTDDSDVTFNICLGREFTGAKLNFCGRFGTTQHRQHMNSYSHIKGGCVVHLGKQRHGAANIESGERVNLIIWNRSLMYRTLSKSSALVRLYPKEESPPDPVCLSRTHDRDWNLYEDSYEEKKEEKDANAMSPWCPPPGKEHDESPLLKKQ